MRSALRSLPLLAGLALAGALGTLPLSAAWSPLGGPVTPTLTLQPGSARLLYARASNENPLDSYLWRSADAGATWRDVQPGLGRPISALAIDPADPRLLWAWTVDDQLWRSADAGTTWSHRPAPAPELGYQVIQLLVDPHHPGTLYRVDVGGGGPVVVYVSRDGGATFERGAVVSQSFSTLDPVRFQPARGRLLSFTELVFAVSLDGGATWQARGRYLGEGFKDGAAAPSAPDTLYGLSVDSVNVQCLGRSDDGGFHWRPLAAPGLPSADCESVAVDPRDARHVWLGVQTSAPDGSGARNVVLESRNGGATWSAPFAKPAGTLVATGGETLYTHEGDGLWASHDGGRTWASKARGIVGGDLRSGLVAQRLPGGGGGGGGRRLVALNAAGYGAAEPVLYRSDGGRDWAATPLQPAAVAGAGGSTLLAADDAGVERSVDGGATWRAVPSAPPLARALLPDLAQPRFQALVASDEPEPSSLLAFWVSDDAGATWRRASTGLPVACSHVASVDECADFAAYAVDPFDPGRRWVAAQRPPEAPMIFTTTDAGASWQAQTSVLEVTHALAADPAVPGRLLAGTDSGLFASADDGAHWLPLGDLPAGAVIRQFARDGATWYAATTGAGIFRSQDGGAHWTLLAGVPDLDNPTIAVDPRRPAALLTAFRGQGVWRWTP